MVRDKAVVKSLNACIPANSRHGASGAKHFLSLWTPMPVPADFGPLLDCAALRRSKESVLRWPAGCTSVGDARNSKGYATSRERSYGKP